MRKYQAIWEQVKLTGTAELIAPVASHTRIVNAVRKEKMKDLGWALLQVEANPDAKHMLMNYSEGKHLKFYLTKKDSILSTL
jgi:hypothetical protein